MNHTKLLILGILVMILVVPNPSHAWWNTDWQYRMPIEMTEQSGTDLTDYQVKIVVDTASLISAGKMNSDCSDMRFVDSDDSTSLPYWIESGCNTASTVVWVKVPSIPASSSTTIYMYYGNPSATSESDGDAVFDLYDDFESGTIDTNKWTIKKTSGVVEVVNGRLHVKAVDSWEHAGVYTADVFDEDNKIFEVDIEPVGGSGQQHEIFYQIPGTETNYIAMLRDDGPIKLWVRQSDSWNNVYTTTNSLSTGTEYHLKIITTGTSIKVDIYDMSNNLIESTGWHSYDDFSGNHLYLGMGTTNDEGYFDNIIVRKYADPEPTYSIGAEEIMGLIPPKITVYSPANTTYYEENIPINFTVYGNSSTFHVKVYKDGSLIYENSSFYNNTNLILDESWDTGLHYVKIWANDTTNNIISEKTVYFTALICYSSETWWNNSFEYRRKICIQENSGNTLSDYQVKLVIESNSGDEKAFSTPEVSTQQGIATDGEYIYVNDGNKIYKYTVDGTFVSSSDSYSLHFGGMVYHDGLLYIAVSECPSSGTTSEHYVYVFNATTLEKVKQYYIGDYFDICAGAIAYYNNSFYVAESYWDSDHYDKIVKFDKDFTNARTYILNHKCTGGIQGIEYIPTINEFQANCHDTEFIRFNIRFDNSSIITGHKSWNLQDLETFNSTTLIYNDRDDNEVVFLTEFSKYDNLAFTFYNFSSQKEQPIPFWVELRNSTHIAVWIKVPEILSSDVTTIYMYYDYGSINNGDPDDVFEFFDNFEGTSLNTSKWIKSSGITCSLSNSIASCVPSQTNDQGIKTINTFNVNGVKVYAKIKAHGDANDNDIHIFFSDDITNHHLDFWLGDSSNPDQPARLVYEEDWLGGPALSPEVRIDKTNYRIAEFVAKSGNWYGKYGDGSATWTQTHSYTNLNLIVSVDGNHGFDIDWIYVTKYASTEPTVTVGEEETLDLGNTAPAIIIYSPSDGTYYTTRLILNFTVTDDNSTQFYVKVDIDGDVIYENSTFANATIVEINLSQYLVAGTNTITVFANDTDQNSPLTASESVIIKEKEIKILGVDVPASVYETTDQNFTLRTIFNDDLIDVYAFGLIWNNTVVVGEEVANGTYIAPAPLTARNDFEHICNYSSVNTTWNGTYVNCTLTYTIPLLDETNDETVPVQMSVSYAEGTIGYSIRSDEVNQTEKNAFTLYIENPPSDYYPYIEKHTIDVRLGVDSKVSTPVDTYARLNFEGRTINCTSMTSGTYDYYFGCDAEINVTNLLSENRQFDAFVDVTFQNKTKTLTATRYYTVYRIIIAPCNASVSTEALRFIYYDESTGDNIQAKQEIIFRVKEYGGSFERTYSYVYNYSLNATYCINPDFAVYETDADILYYNENYTTRTYYLVDAVVDANLNTINLYLAQDPKEVRITVVDNLQNPIENAIVKIDLFDWGNNRYITVASVRTDFEGKATTYLVLENKWYRFVVQTPDGLTYAFSPTQLNFDASVGYAPVTLKITEAAAVFGEAIAYTCEFDEDNLILKCFLNEVSGLQGTLCLTLYKQGALQFQKYDEVCTQDTSSVLWLQLTNESAFYYWQFTFVRDNEVAVIASDYIDMLQKTYDVVQVLLAVLLVAVMGLLGLYSPAVAITSSIVALIISNALGLVVVSYSALVSIIIVGAIIIHKVKG